MHSEECRDRGIEPRHLHRDQADQQLASAGASVPLDAEAADVQLLEGGEQFEREGVFDPVLVDYRRDLGFHEGAHLFDGRQFVRAQGLYELIEIAIRWR